MIDYRATSDWPHALAAGCVVYKQAEAGEPQYLLLYRSDDLDRGSAYMLPKGHVDAYESPLQAAQRETAEEAGVNTQVIAYLGSTSREYVHPRTGIMNHKTVLFFLALYVSDTLEGMDHEHDKTEWLNYAAAYRALQGSVRGDDEMLQRAQRWLDTHRTEPSDAQ